MVILRQFKHKKNGVEEFVDIGALAQNITEDSTHRFVSDAEKQKWNGKLDSAGDIANAKVSFSQAATRANINTGETVSTISGKLKKWYADFKTIVWTGSYSDLENKPTLGSAASQGIANNLTTTAAGYAMDARQGPVIQQHLNQINQNLAGLSITVTATDNSLQAILPTLYNTARDKGYLDRHNRTFHAMILNSSGAYMGDWNGYFSGDNTAIYGNAYSINLDSTYQFRTSAGGADAVIKKLGNPEVHRASGSGLIIDTGNPTGNIGGVTSLHYKGNYYCGNNNWIEMEYTMSITCENGIVRISGAPGGQGTFTVSAFSLTGD